MKPRSRPDDDSDENDAAEMPAKPEEGEDDVEKPKRDSAGRIKGSFGGGGRPMPDISRRDDDELIVASRPGGSYALTAHDDPKGFMFTTFNTAKEVEEVLIPKSRRKAKKRSRR